MKKGDIVTVVAISGEYVGKFNEVIDGTISLDNPRMIVSNPEGGMGFAHGVAVTGLEAPTNIVFNNYVFATQTNSGVERAFIEATTSIQLVK